MSETRNDKTAKLEINLRFFGPIIGVIGKSHDIVTLPSNEVTTIREIIDQLCRMYGERFQEIALNNKGELNPGLIVFVNGAHVTDEKRKLSITDEIQMMIASQMKGG